jgi:hypothetical protein
MMVLNYKCKRCNNTYYEKCFQQDFENWASGYNNVYRLIRDNQLLAHDDVEKILEWIPYHKFQNVIYITENRYRGNWV